MCCCVFQFVQMAKFGEYQKDNPATFQTAPEFAFFPQFMFHLRRSQFLQVFNSSPDETAFYRYILCRENVANSLVMIQPTLTAYEMDVAPQPAHLDARFVCFVEVFLLVTLWPFGSRIVIVAFIAVFVAVRWYPRACYCWTRFFTWLFFMAIRLLNGAIKR
jgi:hypothetical protein